MNSIEQFLTPTKKIINIPLAVLKASYIRYEPYNLGITHRHPLRLINAAAIYGHDAEGAKDVLLSTYPIGKEQILAETRDGLPCITILLSLVENNVQVIETAMRKLGYARIESQDKMIMDSLQRQWLFITFSPNNEK